jgi:hypothetical protein
MMQWLHQNAHTVDPTISIPQKGLLATVEIWARLLAKRRRLSKPQLLYHQWPEEINHEYASKLAKLTANSPCALAAKRLNLCLEVAKTLLLEGKCPSWLRPRDWQARVEWVNAAFNSDVEVPFWPPNNLEINT